MKFKQGYRFDTLLRKSRSKSVQGGVEVGGPFMQVKLYLDDGTPKGYCVDVVLTQYVTGISRWSIAVDDRTLRHFTTDRLPDVIKNAITLIIPYADQKALRKEVGIMHGGITLPGDYWEYEFENIGWYLGKAIWYPEEDLDSPVEEQLFTVVVTPEQLEELREPICDLS